MNRGTGNVKRETKKKDRASEGNLGQIEAIKACKGGKGLKKAK